MNHRVLYIEDNPANFALVHKVLQGAGLCRVIGADTGERGIDAAREQRPDLVLLDLDLPGISGFEVARLLKTDPAMTRIPVIAVSASVMKHERSQAIAAGCVAFVDKPFDINALRSLVTRTIECSRNDPPA